MEKDNQDLIRELAEIITLLADEDNDYDAEYIASKYLYDLATKYMYKNDS